MNEMTRGNPVKLILIFTVPLLIGNLFQQLYSTVDSVIVGQTLGKDALASIGATTSINFLILGFALGMTSGLTITTAQRFGARDYRGVRVSFATGIVISFCTSLVLSIVSVLALPTILKIMHTPKEIVQFSQNFMSIILIGMIATVFFNLFSSVLRALGDSRTPLLFLVIAVILNIFGDLFLITKLHWHVEGAATATIVAQFISCLCCIFYIYQKNPYLQLRKEDFARINIKEIKQHVQIAYPMAFQYSIIAIGTLMVQGCINSLGTNAVAANTACAQIDQFATLPLLSFGAGCATYSAQNFGAKEYKRIKEGVLKTVIVSVSIALVSGVLMMIFGRVVVQLFINAKEAEVFKLAKIYFYCTGSSYWLLAILLVLRGSLQGLGKSKVTTVTACAELFMRVVVALFLTPMFGYAGVATANPFAWLGAVVVLVISFRATMKELHLLERNQNQLI